MRFSFKDLVKLSRPRFWLYLGGTYMLGFSAGIHSIESYTNSIFIINLVYFLIIANIFLYGINDYFDSDTDAINPKKNDKELLLQGSQKPYLRNTLVIITIISSIVAVIQSNALLKLLFLLFILLSYCYSAPPVRFKARPYIDFLSNILYILPGIIGYVQATRHLPETILMVAFASWAFAMHLFSAIPDIEPDSKAKITTSAVFLGKTKSLIVCTIFWGIFSGILISKSILTAFNLLTLVYPAIPLMLLVKPNTDINKVYWAYPYINNLVGFMAYLLIMGGK